MLQVRDGRAVGEHIPEWVPSRSDEVTLDLLVREYSRIAFNDTEDSRVRLKAMESLGKHAGMFIERIELSTPDTRRRAALSAMFDSMSIEEKQNWLRENTGSSGSGLLEGLGVRDSGAASSRMLPDRAVVPCPDFGSARTPEPEPGLASGSRDSGMLDITVLSTESGVYGVHDLFEVLGD